MLGIIRIGQDYPHDGAYFQGILHQIEENIWEIVVMTTSLIEVKGILIREEDLLMKRYIPTGIEDLQEEEDHKMMEDPLMNMEDPLMEEDPLMVEDPQWWRTP